MMCLLSATLDAVKLRRIFVLQMKLHWGSAQNMGEYEDALTCLFREGNLYVGLIPSTAYDLEQEGPAVLVSIPEGVKYKKTGTESYARISEDNSTETTSYQANCGVVFSHLHKDPDTALAMAESSFGFMTMVAKSLVSQGLLAEMTPMVTSAPVKVDPENKASQYRVDLAWNIWFTTSVLINTESHRIKEIVTAVSN